MVTDVGPISAQAGGPLSPLVGSLISLKALGSLGLALSIQERDVDRHASI